MKLLPLFLLVAVLSVTTAQAATRTWIGNGADNKLSTPENWIQGVAPTTGDDIVFPSFANQYFFLNDLPAVFNSVTFLGNSYSCLGGGSKALALNINAGAHNLGPDGWTLSGPLVVANGAYLTAFVSGNFSHFSVDGGGNSSIRIRGAYAGAMTKRGSGRVDLSLSESYGGFSVLVESGWVKVLSGNQNGLDAGQLIVTGGTLESPFGYNPGAVRITGPNSELTGLGIKASGSLEISDGARLTLKSCFSIFEGRRIVLRDAYLNPQFLDCGYWINPILIDDAGPITGNFNNYPDGSIIGAGGRRFRVKYEGFMASIRPISGIAFDLDRDAKADISTFRPSDGTWYSLSGSGYRAAQWGLSTDKPVPGDYDGDERMDLAVYRPAEGTWYVLRTLDGTAMVVNFGLDTDIPTPVDFDGDGRADPTVYRPTDGNWWIKQSNWNGSIRRVQYGLPGDVPVAADYDGDGQIDVAIFRPSTGLWSHCYSYSCHPIDIRNTQWGLAGDRPVPADYDGDGKADVAVFRPSEGNWYQLLSSTQAPHIVNWGIATDQPVPADYDGDGRADVGIFRPSDGNWWINRSTAGVMVQQFGTSEDRPIPGAFIQ